MSVGAYLWQLYRHGLGRWALAWAFLALTWIAGAALLALSGWFVAASALAGAGLLVGLNIFTPSTAIRGLALAKPVTRYLERIVGHAAVLRLLADLRVRLFGAIAAMPAALWQERSQGQRHADLVTRLTQDIDTLDGVPLRVIGPMVGALLTLLAAVVAMATWGTSGMALLLGLGGIGIFALAALVAALGRRHGAALVAKRAAVRIALHDHLDGLAELKAYGKAASSLARLEAVSLARLRSENGQEALALLGEQAVQALIGLWLLGFVALGWGAIPAPSLALVALLTLGLGEALAALPGAWWRFGESEAATRRIMALEAPADAERATGTSAATARARVPAAAGVLLIDALRCQRQPGQEGAWTATVRPGRPLVIHGASGHGKSSLLDTLAGELCPISGRIAFDGIDWLAQPDAVRYRRMAYLGQQDYLLDLPVREFLRLGLGASDDAALHRVLEAVALDEVFRQTGEGLDYRLGPRGSRVSGGQARRLQLAALMLRDPDLVLLDEPFRGLDAALMAHLLAQLVPWLEGRCCVLVSHAPGGLPNAWPRLRWPAAGSSAAAS